MGRSLNKGSSNDELASTSRESKCDITYLLQSYIDITVCLEKEKAVWR